MATAQPVIDRRMKPSNFVADGFHTKKLYNKLSSSEVRFYTKNAFLRPHLGGLGQREMLILDSLESE